MQMKSGNPTHCLIAFSFKTIPVSSILILRNEVLFPFFIDAFAANSLYTKKHHISPILKWERQQHLTSFQGLQEWSMNLEAEFRIFHIDYYKKL